MPKTLPTRTDDRVVLDIPTRWMDSPQSGHVARCIESRNELVHEGSRR